MNYAEEARQRIEAGEESEVQGLLEQWLREGKLTQAEALVTSSDMFTAAVDSVGHTNQSHYVGGRYRIW